MIGRIIDSVTVSYFWVFLGNVQSISQAAVRKNFQRLLIIIIDTGHLPRRIGVTSHLIN